jgi:hypothetical protein
MLNPAAPVASRLIIAPTMFPPNTHDEGAIALLYSLATHSLPPSQH